MSIFFNHPVVWVLLDNFLNLNVNFLWDLNFQDSDKEERRRERRREKRKASERHKERKEKEKSRRKHKSDKDEIDPMDPAAYSECGR